VTESYATLFFGCADLPRVFAKIDLICVNARFVLKALTLDFKDDFGRGIFTFSIGATDCALLEHAGCQGARGEDGGEHRYHGEITELIRLSRLLLCVSNSGGCEANSMAVAAGYFAPLLADATLVGALAFGAQSRLTVRAGDARA
jgi:hypothetical protein